MSPSSFCKNLKQEPNLQKILSYRQRPTVGSFFQANLSLKFAQVPWMVQYRILNPKLIMSMNNQFEAQSAAR